MRLLKIDPFVPCARSKECLRRNGHRGECGRVVAVAKDVVRKQGEHLANEAARLVLRLLGHPDGAP